MFNRKHAAMARRKMSHVLDEVYTAMFHYGGKEVSLRIIREENGLHLLGQGDFSPEHRQDMERMAELLSPAIRNPALVEAYWELAGGDQYTSDSEMSLVGQMIDRAHVEVGENTVTLDLFLAF